MLTFKVRKRVKFGLELFFVKLRVPTSGFKVIFQKIAKKSNFNSIVLILIVVNISILSFSR